MPSPSSLSAFAALALSFTMGYLLFSTAAAGIVVFLRRFRAGAAGLRRPAGAYIARELNATGRRIRRHCAAIVLFIVSFGILAALARPDLTPALAPWVPPVVIALVTAMAIFAVVKAAALVRYQLRLRRLLAADLQVAERLEDVQRRGHHVFHAVPVGPHVIDHIVVGAIGVFAMQVVLPDRPSVKTVSMARGSLLFGPGQGEFRVQPTVEAFARLARQLGPLVGHPVKVVPVLVAPGCKVSTWDDDRYLLTNEQNCVALVGWKDPSAYLMDEEVLRISEWLSERCRPVRKLALMEARVRLHACATRPALL
jgi:hypothetical protein